MTDLEYQVGKRLPYMMQFFQELTKHPEGEWFAATNRNSSDFDICNALASEGLIATRRRPIWNNGIFSGYRIEYKYQFNLNY